MIPLFRKAFSRASHLGSPKTSQYSVPLNDSASCAVRAVNSSSKTSGSCIAKQISFESTSSWQSVPSTVTPSSTSATKSEDISLPKPLAGNDLSVNIPDGPDQSLDAGVGTSGRSPPSDSTFNLFSSGSSSSMFADSPSSDSGDDESILSGTMTAARPIGLVVSAVCPRPHECVVYDTSDESSLELAYESVSSGPSIADTASDIPTYTKLRGGDVPPSESDSNLDSIRGSFHMSASPASVAMAAERVTRNPTACEIARSRTWTGILSCDSSSSSLGDLALKADDFPDTDTVAASAGSVSSTPSDDSISLMDARFSACEPFFPQQQLPSFGMAGATLLPRVSQPTSPENIACDITPAHDVSTDLTSTTHLIAIVDEEESQQSYEHHSVTRTITEQLKDTITACGSAMSRRIVGEVQEFAGAFADEHSAITESDVEDDQQQLPCNSRKAFLNRVFREATPLQRYERMEIAWEDVQTVAIIVEEEEDSFGNAVRASASRGSLLAMDEDEFEYAQVRVALLRVFESSLIFRVFHQYSLPSETSANSVLSEDQHSSLPSRPMVSIRLTFLSRTTQLISPLPNRSLACQCMRNCQNPVRSAFPPIRPQRRLVRPRRIPKRRESSLPLLPHTRSPRPEHGQVFSAPILRRLRSEIWR